MFTDFAIGPIFFFVPGEYFVNTITSIAIQSKARTKIKRKLIILFVLVILIYYKLWLKLKINNHPPPFDSL